MRKYVLSSDWRIVHLRIKKPPEMAVHNKHFYAKVPRPRPIFQNPRGFSIVGAGTFHDSVRNGKRWVHTAKETERLKRKKKYNEMIYPF